MGSQNISRIFEQIARGELSVDQALSALKPPEARRGAEREWFPLWLRIVISEGRSEGIRLRIPLFLLIPVAVALFLLFLPLLLITLFVLTLTLRGRIASHVLRFIVPISMAMVHLCFHGRGAGVEVIDGKDEVIVRLE